MGEEKKMRGALRLAGLIHIVPWWVSRAVFCRGSNSPSVFRIHYPVMWRWIAQCLEVSRKKQLFIDARSFLCFITCVKRNHQELYVMLMRLCRIVCFLPTMLNTVLTKVENTKKRSKCSRKLLFLHHKDSSVSNHIFRTALSRQLFYRSLAISRNAR